MIEPVHISAENLGKGEYLFTNLYPAKYTLNFGYKSFEVEKEVSIAKDESLSLKFPAEFELNFVVMNSYGYVLNEGGISVSRNGKSEMGSVDKSGTAKIVVPPGNYEITVYSDGKEIAKQEIDVRGDKEIDILTSQENFLHTIVIYLGIILAIFSIIFMLWKKNCSCSFNYITCFTMVGSKW